MEITVKHRDTSVCIEDDQLTGYSGAIYFDRVIELVNLTASKLIEVIKSEEQKPTV